jgi:YD repeat protein
MKKSLVILIICFISVINYVNAQYKKSDIERLNIKINGKFYPFKEFHCQIEGKIPVPPHPYNIIEGEGNDFRARLKDEFGYEFDINGNIKGCGDGIQIAEMTYEGNREVMRKSYGDYGDLRTEYKYNGKGIIVGKIIFGKNYKGEVEKRWESHYVYDNKGNIIIEEFRDYSLGYGEEQEKGQYSFEYDEKGNLIKTTIEELVEGGVFVYNYKYDSKGNLSEYSYDGNSVELKYDDKGNVISMIGQVGYELVEYTFKYAYDGKGNWVTKYAYSEGKLIGKVKRTIWYDE